MELVLRTLREKKFYLEYSFEEDFIKFEDMPEVIERLKQNIKDFQQTIDIIELHINYKKNK
mgnify:CR=1 FL=1|tara:strand:+ start:301 stop:483 length:183 start_codon:yes stop_codon:yes gene_type:complete